MRILIVGVSTRALAASAVRAGYDVTSLDYFGDRDQPPGARALSLEGDFHVQPGLGSLARAARSLLAEVDAVAFCSGVENEPELLRACQDKPVLGNSARAVQIARDLPALENLLAGCGMRLPRTYSQVNEATKEFRWLVKDLSHSGGTGVRFWKGEPLLAKGEILQEYISGELYSAAFLANGQDAALLGITRQYAGEAGLGAKGFWWCGNVAPVCEPGLEAILSAAAGALTRSAGLVGINGMDFILHDGAPYLLEVNPRCGASAELFEEALGCSIFDLHVQACQGQLPESTRKKPGGYLGKGILYARKNIHLKNTDHWFDLNLRDIPQNGAWIPKGAPVCTITGSGESVDACWQNILEQAQRLRAEIEN